MFGFSSVMESHVLHNLLLSLFLTHLNPVKSYKLRVGSGVLATEKNCAEQGGSRTRVRTQYWWFVSSLNGTADNLCAGIWWSGVLVWTLTFVFFCLYSTHRRKTNMKRRSRSSPTNWRRWVFIAILWGLYTWVCICVLNILFALHGFNKCLLPP